MSICCWLAASFSAAGASSPVRAFEVARRLGLDSASAGASAALADALGAADPPPACASLMTSISWLLRIRAVPLMPRPDATCCSSARTMPSRPVPERRRRAVVPEAAPSAGAALSTFLSAVTPIRSVVSLTKGPSLERTSAFWLGDRLCCPTAVCRSCWIADLAGAVVRRVRRRDERAGSGARSPCSAHSWTSEGCRAGSGACSKLLRQAAQAVGEAPGRKAVPEGDTKQRAMKTSIADLRLTLPAPTNIPPLVHR